MDNRDNKWWLVHTGEYVLGLLDEQDSKVLKRVMHHEPDVEKLVADWGDCLQPMSDSLPPVEPPEHLLPELMNNLPPQTGRSTQANGAGTSSTGSSQANLAGAQTDGNLGDGFNDGTAIMSLLREKQRQADGWQTFAGLTVVLCLFMCLYFFS